MEDLVNLNRKVIRRNKSENDYSLRTRTLCSIFGGLFKAAMPLLKKGTKTIEREALKTGLSIAGDVVQGRYIKQAAKSRLKSTGENLLQNAMDTVGPPGQRVLKGSAKRKKTRRRQNKQWNTSNDIADKNGTCTSQLMRMHEIRTGFI
jgi:hypothetical protein